MAFSQREAFITCGVLGVVLVVLNSEKIMYTAEHEVTLPTKHQLDNDYVLRPLLRQLWQNVASDDKEIREKNLKKRIAIEGDMCECKPTGLNYIWSLTERSDKKKQETQFIEWNNIQEEREEPFVVCPSLMPMDIPGSGLTVEPLQSTSLSGLAFHPLFWNYLFKEIDFKLTFESQSRYGNIYLGSHNHIIEDGIRCIGNDSHRLTLEFHSGLDIERVNNVLTNILYKSTKYVINARDIIRLSILDYEFKINIHIIRKPYPRLYNIAPSDHISKKVTVVCKTFERYEAARKMITSVREFYPNITIIIADDSEVPEALVYPNVFHYIMPFATGWFAGRNLVLSQVRTKYFVWIDDDFIFTENTRLELMLEKLENPVLKIDLVSGMIDSDPRKGPIAKTYNNIHIRSLSNEGYCLQRKSGAYPLAGAPGCRLADEVINFFMAKTLSARSIGFDPHLARFGHHEFFWDGLGKLRVASCDDVTVFHERAAYTKHGRYRYQYFDVKAFQDWMLYSVYKNNVKCFNWAEYLPDKLKEEIGSKD
ncbi:beta-1,4 N-acetylgalactosaminyltransferase 1-like [Saccoglossus kowalevskii]|uniref:Beta-1,4 N-acetylgalactosaminyltransferase 1-like n=1 Tax=Saccoglossus kowalevskii TaxID=10224 RepID=A0ABM0GM84_SACKO|nr:PREDICTED: beta-1,4 N-acetylgalactosaminyltransferase 1-like [Saccoglossus kowalevskii]